MRKLLSLMGIASALLCCAAGAEGKPESPFKMASLVLPQGVSFELGPVTLTRTLDTATSASKSGTSSSKTQEDNSSIKKTVGSGVESTRSSGHSSGRNLGGSIGGGTGGSEGFSLLGLLGLHVDVGGKISSEDSVSDKNTKHNGTESVKESTRGSKNGTTSEIEEVEQYGSYHLKFSVTFKSKDLSDTFLVGGPNARVILEGFSAPVPVPYTERKDPIRLRAEERTLFFDYPIADQVLLRDAKRMVAQGRRNAVTLSLIGDEFPVISERTKDNVISEITRIMRLSPNTLVAVDFGDVRRLSPWRVRRKFTKASGRRGERLTIRDALLALNETIAEYEEMSETTFAFEKGGPLISVSDTPVLAMPRKGDVKLVLFSVVENDSQGAPEAHFPSADFLKRPLGDFSEVRLVVGSLVELARAAVSVPDRVAGLRAEVESALPSVPEVEKFWKEQLVKFETEKASAAEKPQEGKSAKNAEKESEENEGRRAGETKTITLPGGATLELVWCPPGTFKMGFGGSDLDRVEMLNDGKHEEERIFKYRKVTLTKGFWIGKYEVTQRQWESVMGNNPSRFTDPDRPVEQVSWEDCQAFVCKIQSSAPDLQARLPTSAEWECACRAGTETILPNGRNVCYRNPQGYYLWDSKVLHDFAWVAEFSNEGFELANGVEISTFYMWNWKHNIAPKFGSAEYEDLDRKRIKGLGGTHRVGQKEANPWGIYDMSGNVAEWCSDWYNDDFKETVDPENTSLPKIGKDGLKWRVTRGGGVSSYGVLLSPNFWPGSVCPQPSSYRKYDQGFRLCCSAGLRE